ncbi:MAG: TIR domain-containing protein, partial [Actinobacteria bacterium]|nr:TIR domain-containing protein [Actinomycetota bacterium]
MSPGSPLLDAVDSSRELVFVSYSHADAEWVQWLEVLLKPVVRARRSRVWADPYIPVGNDWHRDITAVIERTRVGLLLVSGDFLASDFIMDQELPALIAREVQLAPVLLGDCLWTQVPELARVQWLHDPGRDGALKLVADRPGERDRRLTAICERLIALVPDRGVYASTIMFGSGTVVSGSAIGSEESVIISGVAPTLQVEAVASGPGLGLLDGVPGLPPGYLARDELSALIDAVVTTETGAVGLIGDVAALGLHGQGGIGKSVLACALARDEGVRARFPDGVYWVSVGEQADVLAVQLELLVRLGAADRVPRSPDEARDQLAEVLRERGALLVVDDVWSAAAAQALRVTGPRGRVLYTSRDRQVLAAAGARLHRVEVLSPSAGRALAAGVLDVSPGNLPAAADQAFEAVGRVALAVALLAAAVRGGRSWGQVAEELVRDAGIFGDHPYANTFNAMQLAVGALRDDMVPALLSLAVFPPDTQIPVAAITRYWAHTRGRTAEGVRRDLRDLAAANVLSLDERADDGAVVGLHDLQHDYLLLHAPKLAELHAGLLAAYRT